VQAKPGYVEPLGFTLVGAPTIAVLEFSQKVLDLAKKMGQFLEECVGV